MNNIYGMTTVPSVVKQTNNGERGYDIFSCILEDRMIILGDEVTHDTAQIVIAEMLYLASKDPDKDIILYINSPGGSVADGLAIYDVMQYIKPDVRTICAGMACSMGAFLLAGGTPGKRYALPNAEIMIHQPLGGSQGQATDMKIQWEHMEKTKDKLTKYLAKFTGKDFDTIWQDTERDNWMSAKEAAEYHLIDKVITHMGDE